MKKYILVFWLTIFGFQLNYSQPEGPPDGGAACDACNILLDPNNNFQPLPGREADYALCLDNNCSVVPIDSGLLLLLLFGSILGMYYVSKNKKEVENINNIKLRLF